MKRISVKNRKIRLRAVLGLLLLLCLFSIYELYVYGGLYFSSELRDAIRLADQRNLSGEDFYHLKEGYYCGEGGVDCDHGEGYIYFSGDMDEMRAMSRAGFEVTEFEYPYPRENSIHKKREFYGGGESAVLMKVINYREGFLLWYRITGAA